jgi:hypothetical protein
MSGHVKPLRRFHRFERWSLVPVEDLLKLRQSLRRAQKLLESPATSELHDLLDQVDHELHRRTQTPRWGPTSRTPGPG